MFYPTKQRLLCFNIVTTECIDWFFELDFLVSSAISLIGGMGFDISSKDIEGEFIIQVVGPDGETILFEQRVVIIVNMTALVTSAFGVLNMGFFVWAMKTEIIETTIIDGQPSDERIQIRNGVPWYNQKVPYPNAEAPWNGGKPFALVESWGGPAPEFSAIFNSIVNPSWTHTLSKTVFSEFGTMERGSGTDYTDLGGSVSDWWMSPLYEMRVPVGSKLKILFSGAQGGRVPQNLQFQFRFDEAGKIGSWLDTQGGIRSALPIRNHVYIGHTYYGPSERRRRADVAIAQSATIWKDRTNRMWILAKHGAAGRANWKLWYSDLDGHDLIPLLHTLESGGSESEEGNQVAVWTDAYRNADGKPRGQGGAVTTAQLGSDQYFQSSADYFQWGPIRKVGPHDNKPCVILVGSTADGRERIVITDNVDFQTESTDGGESWRQIDRDLV